MVPLRVFGGRSFLAPVWLVPILILSPGPESTSASPRRDQARPSERESHPGTEPAFPAAAGDLAAPQAAAIETDGDSKDPESPHLAIQIGTDFKNVFTTKSNLAIVGAGLGAAWSVSPLDQRIATSRFNSELKGGTTLDRVFEPGEFLGSAWLQGGGALAVYGMGKLFSQRGVEELGRDLVRAQVVNQALTQMIKYGAGRQRPDGGNPRSFPSGHASGVFSTATVLQRHYGWKVGIPAYAMAGYVAASRLNEARHYLSDVVFGAALGILSGRMVTIGRGRARFALQPMAGPAGTGLQLTWVGPEKRSVKGR
jgi:membrane-associated phospholipid phosphatase